ncbi:hypothetical protein F5J12DRAFT_969103 [Pisolithus orientalis]|uniref:uncharacterized protein n=1 Tax=Pisolithus orientalis TaxID=936130 RepID=UPI0022242C36|nr:uncharacterized protein F5J12DRAFT_969103 [Pisolithus orientalis]KAI5988935.1 hypothetical protein F5J12DRAFT_969103 [Pisolithus orientalis]
MVVVNMLSNYVTLCKQPATGSVMDEFNEKLEAFYTAGFFHGDIHDVNVMVSHNGKTFKIIDFNWAGRTGEARYPLDLSRREVYGGQMMWLAWNPSARSMIWDKSVLMVL